MGGRVSGAFFLKIRTEFIRFFYAESVKPFQDIQYRIENKLSPFDNPPYSEDPEPAYLQEWMDAGTAIDVVGLSCVSLLSDALKMYFRMVQTREIGFALSEEEQSKAKRHGFVQLYKTALGHILDTDWNDCPANFNVIEQVVLARNHSQHGSNIAYHHLPHDAATLRKHPSPFFASDEELESWKETGGNENSYFVPTIKVTQDKFFAATFEIEKLADWIEGRMDKVWEWRRRATRSND
jgi:hypothetical protein